jgi:HK97 family phage portal protein
LKNPFNFFKRKKIDLDKIISTFVLPFDGQIGKDATSWAAIDLICSSFASLNYSLYSNETRQALKEHPLYKVIKYPNLEEGHFQFWYNCAKDYLEAGNCYIYKYIDKNEITSIFRLNPSRVKVSRDINTNQKIFNYNNISYTLENIIHIPSRWGYDGLKGKSIFDECSTIFNNTAEIDNYVNSSFNNAIGNRLVIDISKDTNETSQQKMDDLKRRFIQNYSGAKNAGVPLIKSGKIEYSTIQTDFKDNRANQLIENRNFQEKEISKKFGIPLSLLTGEAKTDLETVYTIFIEQAIRPIASSFEEAINRIISFAERDFIFFEYDYNGLLKTSLSTRIESYIKQVNHGLLSINEVRRKENEQPIEAGDNHFVAANMMPLNDETINAYMAKQKSTMAETGKHFAGGDDKQ